MTINRVIGLIVVLSIALAGRLSAQTTFSVLATSSTSLQGYVLGQSYTFDFTLRAPRALSDDDLFLTVGSGQNQWNEEHVPDPELWATVGGTAFQGVYTRPLASAVDPSASLHVLGLAGNDRVYMLAEADFSDLGLRTPGLGLVDRIAVTVTGVREFTFPGAYVEPNQYFADFIGTYSSLTGTNNVTVRAGGQALAFTVNELRIAAIPEPSAVGALVAASVLGWTLVQRRRRLS